jgi:hypothetical protein
MQIYQKQKDKIGDKLDSYTLRFITKLIAQKAKKATASSCLFSNVLKWLL